MEAFFLQNRLRLGQVPDGGRLLLTECLHLTDTTCACSRADQARDERGRLHQNDHQGWQEDQDKEGRGTDHDENRKFDARKKRSWRQERGGWKRCGIKQRKKKIAPCWLPAAPSKWTPFSEGSCSTSSHFPPQSTPDVASKPRSRETIVAQKSSTSHLCLKHAYEKPANVALQ
ncbi:uncharacterized protein LOC144095448 [Amblyomma americanum]